MDETHEMEKTGKAKRKEKKLKNEPQSLCMDDVPESLRVMDFFEARAKEFSSMVNALKKKGGSKRAFQSLPRHMRRRAMSHNIKRLPRHLHGKGEREMDSKKDSNKKPSRKKRRKPSNLKAEYQSRQKNKKWLETHIWHAKRMKMIDKWGYRLAYSCNDKGTRANYRYSRNGAILSDISYFQCIELSGNKSDLSQLLSPMFPSEAGTTPLSVCLGHKEGGAVMYRPRLYPYHCVGPVNFHWEPPITDTSQRKVWFWIHPSIYNEVLDIFETEVKLFSNSSNASSPVDIIRVVSLRDELLRFRLVGSKALAVLTSVLHDKRPSSPEPPLISECDDHADNQTTPTSPQQTTPTKQQAATSTENKATLTDQQITPIECQATPIEVSKQGVRHLRTSRKWEEINKTSEQRRWWISESSISNDSNTRDRMEQVNSSGVSNDDGSVFGLIVEDPRLLSPLGSRGIIGSMKRKNTETKDWLQEMSAMLSVGNDSHFTTSDSETESLEQRHKQKHDIEPKDKLEPSHSVVTSPRMHWCNGNNSNMVSIFSSTVRTNVSTSIIPHHIINEIRSGFFVKPDGLLDLGRDTSAVPVLLINKRHSSSSKKRPVSADVVGWDLIVPANWGMAFWIPLVYNGARPCGLKELSACVGLESLLPDFPLDYPDSFAGQTAAIEAREESSAKYIRYPPDKRPNYGKLKFGEPFSCDWSELIFKTNSTTSTGEKRPRMEQEESEDNGKKARLSPTNHVHRPITDPETDGGFYVLRNSEDLTKLTRFIDTLFSKCWQSKRTSDKYDQLYTRHDIGRLMAKHCHSLVTVRLEVWSRGTLQHYSSISVPTNEDLTNLKTEDGLLLGPVESMCSRGVTIVEGGSVAIGESQLGSKKVKLIQNERKKLLKQTQGNTDGVTSSSIAAYQLKPVEPSRTTIGRINETVDYRYTSSRYSGMGHCTFTGLVELCKVCYVSGSYQLLCLTRAPTTHQYVFTLLKIQ